MKVAQINNSRPALNSRAGLAKLPLWQNAFATQRKDHRYYAIIAETLANDFAYHYFVLADRAAQANIAPLPQCVRTVSHLS